MGLHFSKDLFDGLIFGGRGWGLYSRGLTFKGAYNMCYKDVQKIQITISFLLQFTLIFPIFRLIKSSYGLIFGDVFFWVNRKLRNTWAYI